MDMCLILFSSSFRLFEVDPETYEIVDIHTYLMDLRKANAKPDEAPEWRLEYRFKEAYAAADSEQYITPDLLDRVSRRMLHNVPLFETFATYKYKSSPVRGEPCTTDACRFQEVCSLMTASSGLACPLKKA